MRALAALSGVSQALIHHHFGTKEEVYASVHRRLMHNWRDQWAPAPAGPGERLLQEGLRAWFGFCRANPRFVRLSTWSVLEGPHCRHFAEEADIHARVRETLQEAQRMGHLRADIDPGMLLFMLAGVAHSWVRYRDRFQGAYAPEADPAELDERYLELTLKVLLEGAVVR